MERILEFLKPSPDDFSKKNITQQQWEEFTEFLKQRSYLYKEESKLQIEINKSVCVTFIITDAQLEEIFKNLKFGLEDLKFFAQTSNALSEIFNTLEDIQGKVLNSNTTTLSHAERLRKHSNYVSKMKICIKIYINLNERLSKEIKATKR